VWLFRAAISASADAGRRNPGERAGEGGNAARSAGDLGRAAHPTKEDPMQVRDVMTKDVIAVAPETPLKDVAAALVEHGISGVPVRSENRLVGVLSEGDIVVQEQRSSERSGFARFVAGAGSNGRPAARTTEEAMSAPAITIGAEQPIAAAARLMTERGVKRLPVVRDGELVGIVTRADLVRAFVRADDEIAQEIREDVLERALWIPHEAIRITVDGGEVYLDGEVPRRSDAELAERLTHRIPGVVAVHADLVWEFDDQARRVARSVGRH
jgi:CBS domain-containing protein